MKIYTVLKEQFTPNYDKSCLYSTGEYTTVKLFKTKSGAQKYADDMNLHFILNETLVCYGSENDIATSKGWEILLGKNYKDCAPDIMMKHDGVFGKFAVKLTKAKEKELLKNFKIKPFSVKEAEVEQ